MIINNIEQERYIVVRDTTIDDPENLKKEKCLNMFLIQDKDVNVNLNVRMFTLISQKLNTKSQKFLSNGTKTKSHRKRH